MINGNKGAVAYLDELLFLYILKIVCHCYKRNGLDKDYLLCSTKEMLSGVTCLGFS